MHVSLPSSSPSLLLLLLLLPLIIGLSTCSILAMSRLRSRQPGGNTELAYTELACEISHPRPIGISMPPSLHRLTLIMQQWYQHFSSFATLLSLCMPLLWLFSSSLSSSYVVVLVPVPVVVVAVVVVWLVLGVIVVIVAVDVIFVCFCNCFSSAVASAACL